MDTNKELLEKILSKIEAKKTTYDQLGNPIVNDLTFSVTAPCKITALYRDVAKGDDSISSQYIRTVSLAGNEDFILHDIVFSKVGNLIFRFSPMDSRQYKYVESMDTNKLFIAFPTLEKTLCDIFQTEFDDSLTPGVCWRRIKKKMINEIESIKTAEINREMAKQAMSYENVPGFGAFS